MKFAPVAIIVGFAGTLLAANLQGPAAASTDSLVAAMSPSSEITGAIPATQSSPIVDAVRLIDLRNGTSCKVAGPAQADEGLRRIPLGPSCAASPDLSRVAYWRTTGDGSLVMTDHEGETVLEFMPGDGVLYESVYPSNALITIVPARS